MQGEDVKKEERIGLGMSLMKINGHAVPQSASTEDVSRALERAWGDGRGSVNVVFKDIAQENFARGLRKTEGGGETSNDS